jgi:16S rRNA (guanine527-N7)-methyltransferase
LCALVRTAVSRETAVRLDRFVALLWKWQEIAHLIASSTVENLWTRHIAVSLQPLDLAGAAKIRVDAGTGDAAKCGARADFIDVCLLAPG